MTAPAWLEDAACRDVDPEVFFPHPKALNPDWATPRAICLACPAVGDCLEAALDRGEDHGMFGGKTPAERAAIRRRPRRIGTGEFTGVREPKRVAVAVCGTYAGYNRHRREQTVPCALCRQAVNDYLADYRARRKAGAA